jgi:hypothetical protein
MEVVRTVEAGKLPKFLAKPSCGSEISSKREFAHPTQEDSCRAYLTSLFTLHPKQRIHVSL